MATSPNTDQQPAAPRAPRPARAKLPDPKAPRPRQSRAKAPKANDPAPTYAPDLEAQNAVPWKSGTDLRDKSGVYRWPQAIFPGEANYYPSVTTILDQVGGGMRFAEHWFHAEYGRDVALAAQRREKVSVWLEKGEEPGAMVEVSPVKLLTNTLPEEVYGKNFGLHWMKSAGPREMTRRANRGSIVHDAIEDRAYGQTFADDEVEEWAATLISARGYAMTAEYVAPYIRSALKWFGDHVEEVEMAEALLMNDRYVYAGTGDLVVTLRNYPDIPKGAKMLIDLKTSKDPQPTHELQQAAYFFAEYIGIAGSDRREPMPRLHGAANVYVQPEKTTLKYWPRIRHCAPSKCVPFAGFLHLRAVWQTLEAPGSIMTIKPAKVQVPRSADCKQPHLIRAGK